MFVRLKRIEWYQPLGPIQSRTSQRRSRRSWSLKDRGCVIGECKLKLEARDGFYRTM
ncbi:hypothetical protein LINPERHAP1_LOCUS41081 [Linum perenne]